MDSWTWGRSWTCSISIPLSPYFFHLSHPYTSCNKKKIFFWCAKKEHAMYIIALLLVATNIQNCAVRKNLWHWLHSPPSQKNKQLLNHHQQVPLYTPPSSNPTSDMKPSASELDSFFKTLPEIGKPVAILSIVPIFCEVYVPLHVKGDLPSPLKKL